MSFYLIRPDETEEPTWVAVEYPASSMSVYVWVPALGRFVYSPEMSSEFGYSLRETLFDRISTEEATEVVTAGKLGVRDGRVFKDLMAELAAQPRTLTVEQVLPGAHGA